MAKPISKKKADDAPDDVSFEKALARLEKIVEQLDDGNLPLGDSLRLFREGSKLAKACREMLERAEVQVKEALRDAPAAAEEDDDDEGDDFEEEAE
jgi:exodeoxyribonuclease VII small subunit